MRRAQKRKVTIHQNTVKVDATVDYRFDKPAHLFDFGRYFMKLRTRKYHPITQRVLWERESKKFQWAYWRNDLKRTFVYRSIVPHLSYGLAFAALILYQNHLASFKFAFSLALAYDTATSTTQASSASSLTYSHTTSGSNRGINVYSSVTAGNTFLSPTAAYGGTSMTRIGGTRTNASSTTAGNQWNDMYYLSPAASGANNVVLTYSASWAGIIGGSISFTGCDQTTMMDGYQQVGAAGSTPSITVASAVGDMVIYGLSSNGSTTDTPGGTQTQRWTQGGLAWGGTAPGASSVIMSHSLASTGGTALIGGNVRVGPTIYTVNLSDSFMNASSRSATVLAARGYVRNLSDSFMNAASRTTTLAHNSIFTRVLSDSIMNAAGRLISVLKLIPPIFRWDFSRWD